MFKFTSSGANPVHVLAFEPGSKWQYGPSTLWAGRLVEAVSGQDLEKYLQQNVLGPLGMNDTTFVFPKESPVPDFSQLTERQKEIYEFIRERIEGRGFGPTVREIGEQTPSTRSSQ